MQSKSRSVFVSYKYEDKYYKDTIKQWELDGRLGPYVVITGESEDVRINGHNSIKNHLAPKLQGMDTLLVIVGQDSHNRPWVDYEVHYAKTHNRKIVAIRIPGTTGATPFEMRDIPIITFEPDALNRALNEYLGI